MSIRFGIIHETKNKLTSMSIPMQASIAFVFVNLVNKGIAFLTTPLFTRLMSKNDYGQLSTYNSWLAIVTILATFQFSSGVFNKAMIKYKDDRDGYTSSMLFLTSVITCCLFVVYWIFRKSLNSIMGLSTPMMFLMMTDIFFTSGMSFWTIRNRFEFNYKGIVAVSITSNIIATGFSILLVIYAPGNKAFLRVLGLVVTHIIFYFFIHILIYKKKEKILCIKYWQYSIGYNAPLIPHYLSQQILSQSDRIMISNICGYSDAAVYSLAYQVAMLMQLVTDAVHASFMPYTFQKLKDGDINSIGKKSFQIELLIGSVSLLFSLFAPEFILILGGKSYLQAVYIVPPVAMSVLFITIYSLFGNIEFYFEKTKLVMIASSIVACLNLLLNSIFIPRFGFVAAGYTTLVCYIFYSMIHYIFMKKICLQNGIDNPYYGKKMWGIAILFTFISVVVSYLYRFFLQRYVVIGLLMACSFYYFLKKKKI